MICLLGYFFLLFAAIYIEQLLTAPELIENVYAFSINGVLQPSDPIPNPRYPRGALRTALDFLRYALPTGQSLLLGSRSGEHPLRMILCSLGVMAGSTTPGLFAFAKKDI